MKILGFTVLVISLFLFRIVTKEILRHVENDPDIDLINIKRTNQKLYYDISVIVTYEAINLLMKMKVDMLKLLADAFTESSKIYSWHNIDISVKELEFWKDGNKVVFPHGSKIAELKHFVESRKIIYDAYVIFHEFNDESETWLSSVGFGTLFSACTNKSISMLLTSAYANDSKQLGEVIAHELGHNLGFGHTDEMYNCLCVHKNRKYCIMHAVIYERNTNTPKSLENCHITRLANFLPYHKCLLEPMEGERLFKRCGDGVLDVDEECDCGFHETCYNLTDHGKYCDMNRCKYSKPECRCLIGKCCKKCLYVSGLKCREAYDECDVEEYCDGTQKECPVDVIKKNFGLCNNNRGICYNGMCTNFNSLCKYIYKEETASFSQSCVNNIKNTMKNYCSTYRHHEQYDIICNKYPNICQHFLCVEEKYRIDHTTEFGFDGTMCIVPTEDIRIGVLKTAPNYMLCGKNSYCFDGHCIHNSSLLKNCDGVKCTSINNNYHYKMDKKLNLPKNRFGFRLHPYENYLTNKSSENNSRQNHPYVIWIVTSLIILSILILLVVWRTRNIFKGDKSRNT